MGAALALYVLFVVYGSLIPFRLREASLEQALEIFARIPYLSLGVASRADWIANGLLYIPLAFLAMAWLHRSRGPDWVTGLRAIGVFAACAALALAIEFVQIFFSPRTVSINDLIAEVIGTGIGLGLWRLAGTGLARHYSRALRVGGGRGIVAALAFYLAAYLVLALFPFDLLLSGRELSAKLARGGWGWLLAPAACPSGLRCVGKLLAEVVATMPIGALVYFAHLTRSRQAPALEHRVAGGAAEPGDRVPWRRVLLLGSVLGAVVEVAQLFLASGTTQGLSVATRIVGLWLGAAGARTLLRAVATTAPVSAAGALGQRAHAWSGWRASRWGLGIQGVLALGALPYVLAVLALNGWFRGAWQPLALALEKLRWEMVLPFYFHYFSTETGAMESLLANLVLYVLVGVGVWGWRLAAALRGQRWGGWAAWDVGAGGSRAVALAVVLALVAEAGKLFVPGKHPDPTNLLIAAAGGWLGYAALAWLRAQLLAWQHAVLPAPAPATVMTLTDAGAGGPTLPPPVTPRPRRGSLAGAPLPGRSSRPVAPAPWPGARSALALGLLIPVVLTLLRYPVGGPWLALGLIAYGATLWQRPRAWLFALPAAVPLLDLAVWSGWFFIDELDLLVLVTLAVLLVRAPPRASDPPLPVSVRWLTALLALALAVSAARGLLPVPAVDLNAFAHYYSQWNAWRVGKGFLWAFLLLPFLRRAVAKPGALERYFVPGVLAGLGGTVALVLWERWAFPGLLNFAAEYRATAGFSSMHLGGASVDVYLTVALPFVGALFLIWRDWPRYAVGLILFAGGLYALLVTFSRIDYLAFVLMAAVLGVALARARLSDRQFFAIVLPAGAITVLVAVPIFLAPYVQVRFASLEADAEGRAAHWRRALELRDDGWATGAFGMGLGSFPRAYFWSDPGPRRPGSFSYLEEGGDVFLRLGAGLPLYVLQRVDPGAGGPYHLSARLRSAAGPAALKLILCEKSLLYSGRCAARELAAPRGGGWVEEVAYLNLPDLGRRGRPVYLALYNPRPGTQVDVTAVSLVDPGGREILANGDFGRGFDRWYFTSDDHLSWHVKSLWVHMIVEAGWLGFLLLSLLLFQALGRAALAGWRGDPLGAILTASLTGLLTLGTVEGVVDTPRLTLLMLLLIYAATLGLRAEPR